LSPCDRFFFAAQASVGHGQLDEGLLVGGKGDFHRDRVRVLGGDEILRREESGSGMRAGHQDKMFEGGNASMDREFARLAALIRASIVRDK
jgi:hypothetical protein